MVRGAIALAVLASVFQSRPPGGATAPRRGIAREATRAPEAPVPTPPARISGLRGRILRPDGRGVRADVLLLDMTARRSVGRGSMSEAMRRIGTEADGSYAFEGVAPGPKALVAANVEYGLTWVEFELNGPRVVDLALRWGVTLEGVVVDEAGTAVSGAEIEVKPLLPFVGVHRNLREGLHLTATDAAGRFRVGPLAPGAPFMARVTSAEHRTFVSEAIAGRDGQIVERRFELARGLRLEGRVLDGSGAPIEEAIVQFGGRRAWTDRAGAFGIGGLGDATGTLSVTREGFTPHLEPGRAGSVEIVLHRPSRIRGRVEGATGTLFACFTHLRDRYRRVAAADGSFELEAPAPGEVEVEIEDGEGRVLGSARVVVADGASVDGVVVRTR